MKCSERGCEEVGRWGPADGGEERRCGLHLPTNGKPFVVREPKAPPPPIPAEPPAEATPRRKSVIPANWPRDMHGMLVGPPMPKWEGLDINQRHRAFSEWIGRIPDPPGGWRGRDAIAYHAIHSMMTFFAPLTSDDWMEWRPIQEAASAVMQMVEAIERETLAQLADETEVTL